jgi:hypothetical protein
MSSLTVDDWITSFTMFKTRTAEEWGPEVRMFAAIAKNGQGRSLPVNNIDALAREFCAALDEGWVPVGAFVLGRCDLGKQMGGLETGIQGIRIGRLPLDQPLNPAEDDLYADLIADEIRKFAKESATS